MATYIPYSQLGDHQYQGYFNCNSIANRGRVISVVNIFMISVRTPFLQLVLLAHLTFTIFLTALNLFLAFYLLISYAGTTCLRFNSKVILKDHFLTRFYRGINYAKKSGINISFQIFNPIYGASVLCGNLTGIILPECGRKIRYLDNQVFNIIQSRIKQTFF